MTDLTCPYRINPRPGDPYEIADCGRAPREIRLLHGRAVAINANACQYCLGGGWEEVKKSIQGTVMSHGRAFDEPPLTRRRLRIGWLLPGWWWGGMERWTHVVLSYIDRTKIDVKGVWLQAGKPTDARLEAEIASVTRLYKSLPLLAANCDALIVSGVMEVPRGLPSNIPCIAVSHGSASWTKDVLRSWSKRAAKMVAVSAKAATVLPTGHAVKIIHNGADLERVTNGSRDKYRSAINIPEQVKVAGFVGRLVNDKGIRSIIEALVHLPEEWHALLVGDGPERHGCRVLAAKLGVSDRLHIPGPTLDIADAYAAMDVFAFPSRHEGFALALVEAWVNGLPCVATDVGALSEAEQLIRRTLAKRVAWPVKGSDLAEAILTAYEEDNPSTRDDRMRAAEMFSAENVGTNWTEYLCELQDELPYLAKPESKANGGCGGCGGK